MFGMQVYSTPQRLPGTTVATVVPSLCDHPEQHIRPCEGSLHCTGFARRAVWARARDGTSGTSVHQCGERAL